MDTFTRRLEIWDILRCERHATAKELAHTFSVCPRTIYHDLQVISLHFPIVAHSGKYGGYGVATFFCPHRRQLSLEQIHVLRALVPHLPTYQRKVLLSVIEQFS